MWGRWADGGAEPEDFGPDCDRACAIVTAIALIAAVAIAWRRRRERVTSATLLYCALTIVFVAVVGNSLEVGENNRFRFLSEPLTWVLVTLVVDRALASLGRGARRVRHVARRALVRDQRRNG